jgi:hypothetical protein
MDLGPQVGVVLLVALYLLGLYWLDHVGVRRRRATSIDPAHFRPFDSRVMPPRPGTPADIAFTVHQALGRSSFLGAWDAFWLTRRLRRGLAIDPRSSILHYTLAYLHAVRGEGDRCLDAAAKAFYFAGGDRFYARPILESPWVAGARPALVREVREKCVTTDL